MNCLKEETLFFLIDSMIFKNEYTKPSRYDIFDPTAGVYLYLELNLVIIFMELHIFLN